MGFLPFFPQLGETIPFISWTQVFSADQAVHSWWVQQEAQGPSVCFLQPLQQSLRGTALHSLLSLSIPGKRKGLGGFLPIPTADYGCYNLYRLTVAFHNTPCHHWPHLQNNQEIGGMTGIYLEAALFYGIGLGLWHCHMLNSPITTAVRVTLCNLQCFVL